MLFVVLLLRGLFLPDAAPGRNLVGSEGKPWTSLSIFLTGSAAAGSCTGSGRTKGDELRDDTHKPLETFAFLARGGVPMLRASVTASRSRAGDLDLGTARVEGFSREDGAAEDVAGLALSADRALLHIAEPSTVDALPGLGDMHRLAAAAPSSGVAATGLNLDGTCLLRPAGAAALFFSSDGTSGRRRRAPWTTAAAATFFGSPFTESMTK
nr:unnamed protein product [Digitaria exilis]